MAQSDKHGFTNRRIHQQNINNLEGECYQETSCNPELRDVLYHILLLILLVHTCPNSNDQYRGPLEIVTFGCNIKTCTKGTLSYQLLYYHVHTVLPHLQVSEGAWTCIYRSYVHNCKTEPHNITWTKLCYLNCLVLPFIFLYSYNNNNRLHTSKLSKENLIYQFLANLLNREIWRTGDVQVL